MRLSLTPSFRLSATSGFMSSSASGALEIWVDRAVRPGMGRGRDNGREEREGGEGGGGGEGVTGKEISGEKHYSIEL